MTDPRKPYIDRCLLLENELKEARERIARMQTLVDRHIAELEATLAALEDDDE